MASDKASERPDVPTTDGNLQYDSITSASSDQNTLTLSDILSHASSGIPQSGPGSLNAWLDAVPSPTSEATEGASKSTVADIILSSVEALPFSVEEALQAAHMQIAAQLIKIYQFFIKIGAIETFDVAFGPHVFGYAHLKAFANAGLNKNAVALISVLPWPRVSLSLDVNSPIMNWLSTLTYDSTTGLLDARWGRGARHLPFTLPESLEPWEVPLTEFRPRSMGFYWTINADTGILKRHYLKGDDIELEQPWGEEEDDGQDQMPTETVPVPTEEEPEWHGDAVELLTEYLVSLSRLDKIPVKLWSVDRGFVTRSEWVYEEVKVALKQYGWPAFFEREEWLSDLPDLVALWKERLASMEDEGK